MPSLIDVGAANSDGTLRLWLARQAMEKGEAMLAAQLAAVARISTSATSLLGWGVTISLAMVAGILSTLASSVAAQTAAAASAAVLLHHVLWPAVLALLADISASICCVIILWPGYWHPPAHAPSLILAAPYETELEVLEALAAGYVDAINENLTRLNRLEKCLRGAWLLFVGSPMAAAMAYAVQATGIGQRLVALFP